MAFAPVRLPPQTLAPHGHHSRTELVESNPARDTEGQWGLRIEYFVCPRLRFLIREEIGERWSWQSRHGSQLAVDNLQAVDELVADRYCRVEVVASGKGWERGIFVNVFMG
jgi:hypothetical protein